MSEVGTREHVGRQRAVIFDFDGTIADSLPAIIDVFEDLTHRPEHFSDEQINELRDVPIPELMKRLGVPRWKAPLLLLRGRRMLRKHLRDISVHKGIPETLAALNKQGIPLYVLSSNSTDNVRTYLHRHDLLHYFRGVYGGASVLGKASKLLKLVDDHSVDVAHSWYVGDEMRDVSAARAVGLRSASVTWGYNTRQGLLGKAPDLIADTPKQLLTELKRAWKR